MRGYDRAIAFAALVCSLLLHAVVLFNTGSVAGNSEKSSPEQRSTRLSFRSVAAPQTPPQPPNPTPEQPPEQPPEPEIIESPEPPPEPVPPPEPRQRAEKTRQPKPPEPQPEPVPQPVAPPTVPSTLVTEKAPESAPVSGTVADPALLEQARQEYLRRLMAHIEAHKHYPRAARRRGLEGEVKVTFVLQQDGRVEAMETQGAHRILLAAASEAVKAAQPMPEPPAGQPLPWEISFAMRFSLR